MIRLENFIFDEFDFCYLMTKISSKKHLFLICKIKTLFSKCKDNCRLNIC